MNLDVTFLVQKCSSLGRKELGRDLDSCLALRLYHNLLCSRFKLENIHRVLIKISYSVTIVNVLPWIMSCFAFQCSKLNFHENKQIFGNYILLESLNILLSNMCLNLFITVIKQDGILKFEDHVNY